MPDEVRRRLLVSVVVTQEMSLFLLLASCFYSTSDLLFKYQLNDAAKYTVDFTLGWRFVMDNYSPCSPCKWINAELVSLHFPEGPKFPYVTLNSAMS